MRDYVSFLSYDDLYNKNFYNNLSNSYVLDYIRKKNDKKINAVFKISLYRNMDNKLEKYFNKIKTKLKTLDKNCSV
jgi:hypothetical protein